MTVAEVEVLVTGNERDALKALDRTNTAINRLAKDGKSALDQGAKTWGEAVVRGMTQASAKAGDALAGVRRAAVDTGNEVDRSMKKAGASGDDAAKKLKATESVLRSLGSTAQTAGIGLTASLTAPLLLAGKAGLTYAGDFEQSMDVFRVTSAATAADMAKVSKAARDLGADVTLPGTSATDAAHAMLELSKAGLSVKDVLGASHGVLQMSAAAQIDNATAAKIAAESLTTFSLVGTKANMVSDLLAASANASTASMTQIADGLAQAGAVYAAAKVSIQDVVTGLSMLANAGIKGSDAGTSMKTMLLALQNPSKDAAAQMGMLGVHIYDAQGRMIEFRKIIGQFEIATKNLTAKQRDHALATVFGSDAVRAASVIVGQGVDKFDALEKAVTKQGVAAKTAGAYNDGFKGALDAATSSGQTMLQGFVEPSLKPLTQMFRGVSNILGAMDDWTPAAKTATLGGAAFLAMLGPGVLVAGGFARALTSIIALKGSFAAAEAVKTAALTATTAAATAAAAAETAEASATKGMTLSALLAEPALLSEAAALDAVAASATGAAGKVGILRGAMAALAGIGLPAVLAGGAVAGVAYLGHDFEQSVAGQVAANKAGFTKQHKASVGAASDYLGKFGQKDLMDVAGTSPGGSYVGFSVAEAKAAIAADAATKRASIDARVKDGLGQLKAALAKDNETEKDQASKAAAARYTAMDGQGKPKKRGGKSAAEKAADKEAREEAAAIKALSDQYYEAAKSVALFGKEQASVSLQYDIDHGKVKRANVAQAETIVGQLKRKEALTAAADAEQKAADKRAESTAAAIEHAKAMGRAQVGLNETDATSLDLFGKKFAALTSAENKEKVLWAIEEARAKLTKDRYDAGQAFAKDTLESLEREIALKSVLTRVDGVLLDIKERRARGETITSDQAGAMVDKAKILDDADWAKQLDAFGNQLQTNINDLVAKAKAGREEAAAGAMGRYADALDSVRARLMMTGDESDKSKAKLVKLAESFGTGATAAQRIASGMGRANVVMAATMRADRVEAFRVQMKGLADSVGDYFAGMATGMNRHFSLSFKGIASGFASLMADMARQQAAASIKSGVSGLFTSALGSLFGGGGGFKVPLGVARPDSSTPFFHATGGPVLEGRPIMVGENGPELFVPSGHGSIATATQTSKAVGARPINVTVNVMAPNPGAFHESTPQIARDLGRAIRQATNGLG